MFIAACPCVGGVEFGIVAEVGLCLVREEAWARQGGEQLQLGTRPKRLRAQCKRSYREVGRMKWCFPRRWRERVGIANALLGFGLDDRKDVEEERDCDWGRMAPTVEQIVCVATM